MNTLMTLKSISGYRLSHWRILLHFSKYRKASETNIEPVIKKGQKPQNHSICLNTKIETENLDRIFLSGFFFFQLKSN